MNRPLALDLCCGKGGWARGLIAAGWEVIGFDTDVSFRSEYPGRFIRADVRNVHSVGDGYWNADGEVIIALPDLVVASPPCPEYSRHDQPWTKAKNPPLPDPSIWKACERIAIEAGAPLILENVRGAQPFHGTAKSHYGSQYLWGDVPALMPRFRQDHRKKKSLTSAAVAERSLVPFELALHIGRVFYPAAQEGAA